MPMSTSKHSDRNLGRHALRTAVGFLWEGENLEEYRNLYDAIVSDVGPLDLLEEVLASEFVSLLVEIRRLRDLKSQYMRSMCTEGLREILYELVDEERADKLADDSMRGRPGARKRVQSLLKKADIGFAAIQARTFFRRLNDFERIDRMILNLDQRRRDVLKELESRRNGWARRARELFEIEGAEVVSAPKLVITEDQEAAQQGDYDDGGGESGERDDQDEK